MERVEGQPMTVLAYSSLLLLSFQLIFRKERVECVCKAGKKRLS